MSRSDSALVKLSELSAGEKGMFKEFQSDDVYLKMLDMGCMPDEKFIVERIAPLGDPISLKLSHSSISIRKSDAEKIVIEKLPA